MRNRKGLEEGDASSPLLLHFDTEHVVRKVQANNEGMKQHSTHQLLLHGDAMNLLGVCEHSLLRGEKTKKRERETQSTSLVRRSYSGSACSGHELWVR